MTKWENELAKYIARKFKEKLGIDIVVEDIKIDINNLDLPNIDVDDLAIIYAFAISDEDFEKAKSILDEVEKRGYSIIINNKNDKKPSILVIYTKNEPQTVICEVKMKLTPDGMIIDFEEQNF